MTQLTEKVIIKAYHTLKAAISYIELEDGVLNLKDRNNEHLTRLKIAVIEAEQVLFTNNIEVEDGCNSN